VSDQTQSNEDLHSAASAPAEPQGPTPELAAPAAELSAAAAEPDVPTAVPAPPERGRRRGGAGPPPARALRLGCGATYDPQAINVDAQNPSVSDLLAREDALPLREGCLDEVRAPGLLQRLGYLRGLDALAEAHRVLAPGGRLLIEEPDARRAWETYQQTAGAEGDPAGLRALGDGAFGSLLPETLVADMVERAGFTDLQLSDSDDGALQVAATRSSAPRFGWLAAVRARGRAEGWTAGLSTAERLAFERALFERLAALPGLEGPAALDSALETFVLLPGAAQAWIDCAVARELPLPLPLAGLGDLARRCAESNFGDALWRALHDLAATPNQLSEPLAALRAAAVLALRAALEDPELDPCVELGDGVTPLCVGHRNARLLELLARHLPRGGPLLDLRVRRAAHGLLARGLRHLYRAEFADARRALLGSANLRQDPLRAFWNLAVLELQVGRPQRAVSFYRSARRAAELAPERAAIDSEEAACLAALGSNEDALELLRRAARLRGEPAPAAAAEEDGPPPAWPPLRAEPVPLPPLPS